MNISVVGQHLSIGNSLQAYTAERLQASVTRYFEQAISANVHFIKQGAFFKCDIVVNEGTGRHVIIKSSSESDDIYNSFDAALVKCEKQLRRYKSKLKDRHHRIKLSEAANLMATKYVISPHIDYEDEAGATLDSHDDNPMIIAEKPIAVETLSVRDAVMKMDLENLPAVMFKNTKNNRINVVYYRKDGNISWVDSQ